MQEGETERRSYPERLDNILAITMVMRVRVQPDKSQISVSRFDTDQDFIDQIKRQIESQEVPSLYKDISLEQLPFCHNSYMKLL